MDFDDLEQEEVARGCTEFSSLPEECPFRKLEEVRIGSTVRVLRDAEEVAAICSRAGIGPQNQQQARASAGQLVKVLQKDVDQTVKCVVPSVGETWFALSALQPAQICPSCGGALFGMTCDRCGRQCSLSAAGPLTFERPDCGAAGVAGEADGQEGEAETEDDDLRLDQAKLEAEIEERICSEAEAEMAEAGGVVGALLEVECSMATPSADNGKASKVYFADAVNKVWSGCAEVFLNPEPALATFGRRIICIFKLLTVIAHVRFQAHARAHFQTFIDTLAKPRTGLRDVVGRWLSSSEPERTKRSAELTRQLDHKVQALVRCLELAIACRPIPVDASCDSIAQSVDRLCKLVLAGSADSKVELSPEEESSAWKGWEVYEAEEGGVAPVPVVQLAGAHTVEVWSAGRRDANGVYTVTIFDRSRNAHGHPTLFSDGGGYIMHAHDCWWIVSRDDKALYVTSAAMPPPRSETSSDDWLLRPFPMIRGTPLVKVSLDASTRLLADLRSAYADPNFQREYQELRLSGGGHVPYTVSVQARILPRYGFEGTVAGVLEMRRHTCFWCPGDAATRKLLRDIHSLLEYGKPFAAPTHSMDDFDQESSPVESPEEECEQRFVLVRPVNGLCNRFSAIVAAWLLAKDLGRTLVVDWQCTPCCNCPMERLLEVPEEILALADDLLERQQCLAEGLDLLEYFHAGANTNYKPPERVRPICLASARDLKKIACGSFCRSASYVDVDSGDWKALRRLRGVPFEQLPLALQMPCISVLAFDDFYPQTDDFRSARAERSALLNCLRPAPGILERVVELPPGTIGVHIRRTDHWEACTFSPEDLFIQKLDELSAASGAGQTFFLATDEPALEERLRQRYGDRLMVFAKRTLDRSTPEGIEDALADLLSLAQCSELFGSFESTFSRTASLFNCIPLAVIFRDPNPAAK